MSPRPAHRAVVSRAGNGQGPRVRHEFPHPIEPIDVRVVRQKKYEPDPRRPEGLLGVVDRVGCFARTAAKGRHKVERFFAVRAHLVKPGSEGVANRPVGDRGQEPFGKLQLRAEVPRRKAADDKARDKRRFVHGESSGAKRFRQELIGVPRSQDVFRRASHHPHRNAQAVFDAGELRSDGGEITRMSGGPEAERECVEKIHGGDSGKVAG